MARLFFAIPPRSIRRRVCRLAHPPATLRSVRIFNLVDFLGATTTDWAGDGPSALHPMSAEHARRTLQPSYEVDTASLKSAVSPRASRLHDMASRLPKR